jgi:folylpolyglutamate synthase/dihydropteroate synthase
MLWGGGLGGIAAAALGRVRWPGRFDLRRVQGCAVIFDGGHNPPAFEVLVPAFRERWAHQPVVLYAARPDKDVAKILARLEPLAAAFIFTRPGKSPGHAPADLARLVRKPALAVDSPDEAMSKLLAAVPPDEVRLCCGSLYLVGYYLEGLLGS